jgi:hypothetical protein
MSALPFQIEYTAYRIGSVTLTSCLIQLLFALILYPLGQPIGGGTRSMFPFFS